MQHERDGGQGGHRQQHPAVRHHLDRRIGRRERPGFEAAFLRRQLAVCPGTGPVVLAYERPDGPQGRRRSWRLVWANAGHLPPLVLSPDGAVRRLEDAGSVPLGVPADERRRAANTTFPAGTTLLLYTDGLVESRHRDLDTGIDTLLGEAERQMRSGFDRAAEHLIDAVGSGHDDRALVLVHRRG